MKYIENAYLHVQNDQYKDAVKLIALATIQINYDINRVRDETSHDIGFQSIMEFQMYIDRRKFQRAQDELFSPENREILFEELRQCGPPLYEPEYMLSQGIGSIIIGALGQQDPISNALLEIDEESVWNDVINKCRTSIEQFKLLLIT